MGKDKEWPLLFKSFWFDVRLITVIQILRTASGFPD
jgi:hypothetical protein